MLLVRSKDKLISECYCPNSTAFFEFPSVSSNQRCKTQRAADAILFTANYTQSKETTCGIAGSRLESNCYFRLAARQFFWNCVSHFKKLTRLVIVKRLGGDLHTVNQYVKAARSCFASPISTHKRNRLLR